MPSQDRYITDEVLRMGQTKAQASPEQIARCFMCGRRSS